MAGCIWLVALALLWLGLSTLIPDWAAVLGGVVTALLLWAVYSSNESGRFSNPDSPALPDDELAWLVLFAVRALGKRTKEARLAEAVANGLALPPAARALISPSSIESGVRVDTALALLERCGAVARGSRGVEATADGASMSQAQLEKCGTGHGADALPAEPARSELRWLAVMTLRMRKMPLGWTDNADALGRAIARGLGLEALDAADGEERSRRLQAETASVLEELQREGVVKKGWDGTWGLSTAAHAFSRQDLLEVDAPNSGVYAASEGGVDDPAAWDGDARPLESEVSDRGQAVSGEQRVTPSTWRPLLRERLGALDPYAFERLTRDLLLAAGFRHVTVTGGSGDEGIDGIGERETLLSAFPVYFQCKRYQGSVGPTEIRDFRGAMIGRYGHAIFITTGEFTSGAKEEARRIGAAAVELIDGDSLCDLLKRHALGVHLQDGEVIAIVDAYFEQL